MKGEKRTDLTNLDKRKNKKMMYKTEVILKNDIVRFWKVFLSTFFANCASLTPFEFFSKKDFFSLFLGAHYLWLLFPDAYWHLILTGTAFSEKNYFSRGGNLQKKLCFIKLDRSDCSVLARSGFCDTPVINLLRFQLLKQKQDKCGMGCLENWFPRLRAAFFLIRLK